MLVLHLWYYLTGYLCLRVEGLALEKFVNLCISRGIYLWGIRRDEGGLVACLGVTNFRLLRPIARSSRCRVKILQKKGIPFYWRHLRGRQVLIGGAFLFFLSLYILGSFLWTIEVTGIVDPARVAQIRAEVEREGIRPGIWKGKIDPERLSRQIILHNPDLAWVNVEIRGTMLVIDAVPKQLQARVGLPCHLVAREEGVIQDLDLLAGEPLVQVGDTVQRGEILIRGSLGGRPIAAQGIVWALIWPEAYGECLREEIEHRRTGSVHRVLILRIGEREFPLPGAGEVPFHLYEKEAEIKRLISWRNLVLPVEAIIITYYEVEEVVHRLSVAEAEERARAAALAKIKSRLSPEARILQEEVKRIPQGSLEKVLVKVTCEVLENIAEPRGFEPEALERERGQQFETRGESQTGGTEQ
ncbi:MAG TPA: sporulation protein YqfD [Firmicutes bacterium]|nr:sporulation protein YqfD [Bacillota bacterium]